MQRADVASHPQAQNPLLELARSHPAWCRASLGRTAGRVSSHPTRPSSQQLFTPGSHPGGTQRCTPQRHAAPLRLGLAQSNGMLTHFLHATLTPPPQSQGEAGLSPNMYLKIECMYVFPSISHPDTRLIHFQTFPQLSQGLLHSPLPRRCY